MAKKKDAKATPKRKASKKKAMPAKEADPPEKEVHMRSMVGGLQIAVCANCGKEIGPLESWEVLPGEEHKRVHRPLCIATNP